MRRTVASLVAAALLAASFAWKAVGFSRTPEAGSIDDGAVIALLADRGLAVAYSDPKSAPVWIVGTRGACRVRVASIAPEGWARALIDQLAAGDRLAYAFDGRFYDEQPVMRTRLDNYRRRLLRYLGVAVAPLELRAVAVSPGCPADVIRAEDAARLSG